MGSSSTAGLEGTDRRGNSEERVMTEAESEATIESLRAEVARLKAELERVRAELRRARREHHETPPHYL